MKRLKISFLALALFAALLLGVWVFQPRRVQNRAGTVKVFDTESDGIDLTYLAFNKKNEKKLEVKCEKSQKVDGERLLMKKITATVFKADKLDEDIRVLADSGRTSDDFNDLHLQGNVRITSPTFTMSSASFTLRGMNELSTKDVAIFKLRELAGRAKAGLLYVFSNRTMRMLRPEGTLNRAGKPYNFQSFIIRVNGKKNKLLLDQEAKMVGAGSTLSGDRITLQFDQDFANLQETTVSGNCFFQTIEIAANGQQRVREITADRIKMLNDPQGRLQNLRISGNGTISLDDGEKRGRISSQVIEISMNAETQTLENVRTLTRGELSSQGRGNVKINADTLQADYDSRGDLARVKAEKNCVYATDDFSGFSVRLDYDAHSERIVISGKDASINSKKNHFESSNFLMQTKLKSIATENGVKAMLVPGKKSVLLGAKPVFITAAAMETSEKGDINRFTGKVNLFQDEIELHTEELLFNSSGARMTCRGGADLKFEDNGELVVLGGRTIAFDSGSLRIVIEGEARLRQGDSILTAQKIELAFRRDDRLETIAASNGAAFSRQNITGKAQFLDWDYAGQVVLFRNGAEITRKGAGTTRGQELRFNLESNEITVSGTDDRSETTIRDRP